MKQLPAEYNDILEIQWAVGADLRLMQRGCHYDYQTQQWVNGHDHAHMAGDRLPLMFCGCDLVTCQNSSSPRILV